MDFGENESERREPPAEIKSDPKPGDPGVTSFGAPVFPTHSFDMRELRNMQLYAEANGEAAPETPAEPSAPERAHPAPEVSAPELVPEVRSAFYGSADASGAPPQSAPPVPDIRAERVEALPASSPDADTPLYAPSRRSFAEPPSGYRTFSGAFTAPETGKYADEYQEPRIEQAEREPARSYSPSVAPPFYAPPGKPRRRETAPEAPRRRSGGFARAFCLALVCALLGTMGGVFGTHLAYKYDILKQPKTTASVQLGDNSTRLDGTSVADAIAKLVDENFDSLTADQKELLTFFQQAFDGTDSLGGALSAVNVFAVASPQVVSISSTYQERTYAGTSENTVYGSGFILSADGYILTNHHVIKEAAYYGTEITVTLNDGAVFAASIVGYEADNDVAVIKIDATGLSAVKIGSSARLTVGEPVFAVGNPRRLDSTITSGIVSALNRKIPLEDAGMVDMFQISAAVNEGNSGGPVYNSHGEVVGIVTAKYKDNSAEGLGFAIPIDDAMRIAAELIESGYVSGKPYIGVTAETVSNARYYNAVEGALVLTVEAGSAADRAGVYINDIITELGGYPVTSRETLSDAKRFFNAGDTTTITVYRMEGNKGNSMTLSITFDEATPTA
ncbi:MAG: trypsin-like peptidase domain-containing protein [Oscillospiraceae bacterium]|jgi:serine protease Do|nr:trypsin-like peptidase domain-containing protein [Oscillospiraceae bacterium]